MSQDLLELKKKLRIIDMLHNIYQQKTTVSVEDKPYLEELLQNKEFIIRARHLLNKPTTNKPTTNKPKYTEDPNYIYERKSKLLDYFSRTNKTIIGSSVHDNNILTELSREGEFMTQAALELAVLNLEEPNYKDARNDHEYQQSRKLFKTLYVEYDPKKKSGRSNKTILGVTTGQVTGGSLKKTKKRYKK